MKIEIYAKKKDHILLVKFLAAFIISYIAFSSGVILGVLDAEEVSNENLFFVILFFSVAFLLILWLSKRHGWRSVILSIIFFVAMSGIHKVGLFFTDLLIMVVFMAIPLYYYLSEGRSIAESIALLGLELRVKWTGVILNGISGAIQMFIISFFISLLLSVIGINDQNKIQEKVSQFPVHIILAAIVLSPLSEEILFRGFLYRHFGLVVSSAVFSISHLIYGSAAELVVTFFLGAFLCRMVEKTNSLYPAVIAHGIFNLTAIIYIRVLAGGSL